MFARRKYELLALSLSLVFGALHWLTSTPITGLSTPSGAVHRFVQSFEGRASDLFFRVRGLRPVNPGVLLVELDERGAQRWGLWPWPRDVMATLLQHLLDADAKIIGLDVSFTDEAQVDPTARDVVRVLAAEPSLSATLTTLKTGLEASLASSPDARLAAVLRSGGHRIVQGVIPYTSLELSQIPEPTLARYRDEISPHLITRTSGSVKNSWRELPPTVAAFPLEGVQTPVAALQAGNRYGHFSASADVDGTIRRAATLVKLAYSDPVAEVDTQGLGNPPAARVEDES